jgi:hypothetical protein
VSAAHPELVARIVEDFFERQDDQLAVVCTRMAAVVESSPAAIINLSALFF